MYIHKGFATHSGFVSNATGVVSNIGELSTEAQTYSKDKGFYNSTVSAEIDLISFVSHRNNTFEQMPQLLIDHVIAISKHVYDTAIVATGEVFADQLLISLTETFQASAENFQSGEIINDSGKYVPEWISWKNKSINTINPDNELKVWFSDTSFKAQYDEFEIVVIPPVINLDDFFKNAVEVRAALDAISYAENIDRVQMAKNGYPETVIRSEAYDYIDPFNSSNTFATNWSVLIYGLAGNNVDSINDAIVNYVLANSTHPRADWVQILPELFKRTEFILIPNWNIYAIPNRTLEAGIYSPIANLKKTLAYIKQVVPSYSGAHIDEHAELVGHPYKSLMINSIGSIDNRNLKHKLTDIFSDYLSVSSTSNDFGRMALSTQNWVLLLGRMLLVAENMTVHSSVPSDMTKLKRGNILYIVKKYQNINYLVAAKSTLPLPTP